MNAYQDPPARELHFSVKRGVYIVLAGALGLAVIALFLSGGSDPVAISATIVLAIPGLMSLVRLAAPATYALGDEGLSVGEGTIVRFDQITGLTSRLTSGKRKRAPVRIYTRDSRHMIPAFLDITGRRVFRELVERTRRAHEQLHRVAGPQCAAGYQDMPPAILEDALRHADHGEIYMFRGRERKGARWAKTLPVIAVVLLAGGILAAASTEQNYLIGIGIVSSIIGGIVLIYSLLEMQRLRGREWLCLHPGGVAMLGRQITGQLTWDEVEKVSFGDPRAIRLTGEGGPGGALFISTFDGANIPVPDYYDCPLPVLEKLSTAQMRAATHHSDADQTTPPADVDSEPSLLVGTSTRAGS